MPIVFNVQRDINLRFNRVVSQGIDFLWDVDLTDVSVLSEENDNIKFLLVAIDVFSRQARVEPLKNKLHGSIIDALNNIFKTGRKPEELRTDKSSEFKNRWVKDFFRRQAVDHYVTQNVTHANYAERFIRTLKVMMYRYFTHN